MFDSQIVFVILSKWDKISKPFEVKGEAVGKKLWKKVLVRILLKRQSRHRAPETEPTFRLKVVNCY